MVKGKKQKPLIPNKQLNEQQKMNQLKDKLVLDRKEKSKERCKLLYKGIMDGIGQAFDEMEKDPKIGEPTFQEVNDAILRAGHAYNQRAIEEQWKNVEIQKE